MTGTDDAGRFARRLLREMGYSGSFSLTTASAHQQPGRESLTVRRPVAEAVLGDGECQGQPLGRADPVRSKKPAVSTPEPPTPCWWTPSRSFFHGQQPDLSWINAGVSTSAHPL